MKTKKKPELHQPIREEFVITRKLFHFLQNQRAKPIHKPTHKPDLTHIARHPGRMVKSLRSAIFNYNINSPIIE